MEKFGRNSLLGLILGSVGLLTVFQCWWLQHQYIEQKMTLSKEIDNILRNTVSNMMDSVFESKMTKLPADTFHTKNTPLSIVTKNKDLHLSFKDSGRQINIIRATNTFIKTSKHDTVIEVKMQTNADTLMSQRPAIAFFNTTTSPLNGTTQRISVIIDTLNIKELERNYRFNLNKNNIKLPFLFEKTESSRDSFTFELEQDTLKRVLPFPFLRRDRRERMPIEDENGALTAYERVRFGKGFYTAKFPDYTMYLAGKILPQVLFSIFLIGITTLSFYAIYHNFLKQKRLTELKNDFISNVTHELKTPITTVGVAIEALSNFNVLQKPEQAKEYLDISRNELNRLSLLVDKVLKMALFEQKEWVIQPVLFNFKTQIEQVLNSLKLQFEKYDAQISFTTEGDNFMLNADKTHVTNVIYNLIDNALKYGGENPKIVIKLTEKAFDYRLTVADSGIGIPPQYQDKIFDKFFRIPTGNVHNVKGHGLGLSYVASIIEKHGGTIEVESSESQGSTFTVVLPK